MLQRDDSERKRRRRLRISGFDYASAGAYLVTICTHRRRCCLGDVVGDRLIASTLGDLVAEGWRAIPENFAGVTLDAFVVMPNHLHGIFNLDGTTPSLSRIVGAFKSGTTVAGLRSLSLTRSPLWQRSFHDHAIRTEQALESIREYIANNPLKWHLDRENPANVKISDAAPRAAARAAPTEIQRA
jgi:putative transposase